MSLKSNFDVGWWEFESSCFYVVDKFGGGMYVELFGSSKALLWWLLLLLMLGLWVAWQCTGICKSRGRGLADSTQFFT